ncbi:hypothetical protein [Aliarcobacter butzleri]|uniref:hypothetical protein n=1 Tax=Aliarcobacter butzleri TaxID=28197 RepID=UPI0021B20BE2|nr:hypothetical protein [Aliarcobacter butzleri]MCT7581414.1 hypothetical protein [Aliarcobacter butzleri]
METNNQKEDSNFSILKLIAIVVALIMLIWIIGWCGVWSMGHVSADDFYTKIIKQPAADIFGSVNALFAGFAFGGVIITIYLQLNEIKATRKELEKTAKSNEKTASANLEISETNKLIAKRADEKFILDLFQIYCSDYFQTVKNNSQKILFSCVGDKEYCDFVISRLFAAVPLNFPKNSYIKLKEQISYESEKELLEKEQQYRYKLDELINFFTILTGSDLNKQIISRCDFNYSFWRPLFWMIAKKQDNRYNENEIVKKYSTKPYFLNVVKELDKIYGFIEFENDLEVWTYFFNHPKIEPFMDERFKDEINKKIS